MSGPWRGILHETRPRNAPETLRFRGVLMSKLSSALNGRLLDAYRPHANAPETLRFWGVFVKRLLESTTSEKGW